VLDPRPDVIVGEAEDIADQRGQRRRELVDQWQLAGEHRATGRRPGDQGDGRRGRAHLLLHLVPGLLLVPLVLFPQPEAERERSRVAALPDRQPDPDEVTAVDSPKVVVTIELTVGSLLSTTMLLASIGVTTR
jgi:hypothetical protein